MIDKRIGLDIPSWNVVVEDDFRRELPADVGLHISLKPDVRASAAPGP